MPLGRKFSSAQLAALSLTGATLLYLEACTIGWSADSVRHHHGFWRILLLLCGYLLPLLLGFQMMEKGRSALRNGVTAGRWPEPEIERLRSALASRTAGVLAVCAAGIGFAWAFLDWLRFRPGHPLGVGSFTFLFICPWMALQKLRRIVARPKPGDLGTAVEWRSNLKPIVSHHWGQG
jgi:hypothetical protein